MAGATAEFAANGIRRLLVVDAEAYINFVDVSLRRNTVGRMGS